MPSYRELLQQTKSEIDEIDAASAQSLEGAVWIDVREADEWQEGHLPGAVHIPRGFLESRIEGVAPDKATSVVLYCASAARSAFAAKTLEELGYGDVHSLAGGFTDWKRNGLEITMPRTLSPEKRTRYSRHLLIPEIGEAGQMKLLDSRILLIGAGGLGSPPAPFLPAARAGELRGRRARLARVAVPRRGRRGNARDRGRGRRRRDEPPAPGDPLARVARHAEGRLREADAPRAEPGRRHQDVPRAPHVRERRADPLRRLGRDRGRRRQLPHALSRE